MLESLSSSQIAVGVFTSSLNLPARALSVQMTWLRDFPLGFLVGGHHVDPQLKMISAGSHVGEDYQSATQKQYLGLKKLIECNPRAPWFFVTGCDAFVFSDNLVATLSQFSPDDDFFIGGHCNQIQINGVSLLYPSGGPGFALSRSLAHKIYSSLESMCIDWEGSQSAYKSACDAAMAYYLREDYGVTVSYVEGFYACPPYQYPGNCYLDGAGQLVESEVVPSPLASHYLSIGEMHILGSRGIVDEPDLLDLIFDRLVYFLSWKLKLKRFPNWLCRSAWIPLRHKKYFHAI